MEKIIERLKELKVWERCRKTLKRKNSKSGKDIRKSVKDVERQ